MLPDPVAFASATVVSSFIPRLRTVAIIPGIDTAAPLRLSHLPVDDRLQLARVLGIMGEWMR